MAVVRLTIYYTGHVQGVGFRYTAINLARSYAVAGYVKNLDDGRVLLEVEGEEDESRRFLDEISESMGRFIGGCTIDRRPPTGEFGPPRNGGLSVQHGS